MAVVEVAGEGGLYLVEEIDEMTQAERAFVAFMLWGRDFVPPGLTGRSPCGAGEKWSFSDHSILVVVDGQVPGCLGPNEAHPDREGLYR